MSPEFAGSPTGLRGFCLVENKAMVCGNRQEVGSTWERIKKKHCREAIRTGKNTERGKDGGMSCGTPSKDLLDKALSSRMEKKGVS